MGITNRIKLVQLVSLIFLTMATAVVIFSGWKYFCFQKASPAEKLQVIWTRDLKKLKDMEKLPPSWSRIREVQFFTGTDKAKDWLSVLKNPIPTNKDGDQILEVLLLSLEEEGQIGAIIQYNLIDEKTGNMIWEMGRTFTLGTEETGTLGTDSVTKAVERKNIQSAD